MAKDAKLFVTCQLLQLQVVVVVVLLSRCSAETKSRSLLILLPPAIHLVSSFCATTENYILLHDNLLSSFLGVPLFPLLSPCCSFAALCGFWVWLPISLPSQSFSIVCNSFVCRFVLLVVNFYCSSCAMAKMPHDFLFFHQIVCILFAPAN